ncbi:MAG: tetratricopeptide repeat protein [Bacteroidota bacterium]
MKIKPIYIYLSVFVIFAASILFFSNGAKKSTAINLNQNQQMPNDEVHGKLKTSDEPSKSNVMQAAIEKLNALKADVEKNPKDTSKVREYADMLTMSHKGDDAIQYYNQILKLDPKRIDVLLQLTYVYFNKGDLAKADDYTNKILKIDKNNLFGLYNTGAIAQAKGDSKKARATWQDLSKRYPTSEVGKLAARSIQQLDAMGPGK